MLLKEKVNSNMILKLPLIQAPIQNPEVELVGKQANGRDVSGVRFQLGNLPRNTEEWFETVTERGIKNADFEQSSNNITVGQHYGFGCNLKSGDSLEKVLAIAEFLPRMLENDIPMNVVKAYLTEVGEDFVNVNWDNVNINHFKNFKEIVQHYYPEVLELSSTITDNIDWENIVESIPEIIINYDNDSWVFSRKTGS